MARNIQKYRPTDHKWLCPTKGCEHFQWQPAGCTAVAHHCTIKKQHVDLRRAK